MLLLAMQVATRSFFVGQLVFAKIKGYPPWPSVISEINGNCAKVVYFNWNKQFNWVGFKKLIPATSAKEIVDKYYGKNIRFSGAINEMERVANFVVDRRLNGSGTSERVTSEVPRNPFQLVKNGFQIHISNSYSYISINLARIIR